MYSIAYGIGQAYQYLSGAYPEQNSDVNQDDSMWPSHQTMVVSFFAAAAGACAIKTLLNCLHPSVKDTPELFWKELESNQRPALPLGQVVVMNQVIAEDLASLQKQMFSSCSGVSKIFIEYIQEKNLKPKSVIDLGCGIGANSKPLLKYGVKVIAIDSMECLLEEYRSSLRNKENQFVSLQCADLLTLEKYSAEANVADIALAIDVLPYLPISCWKSTMEKIVASLKPGGYFFGTVFVKRAWFNHPVVAVHERCGAQYYQIRDLAARLVRSSGLEMVECRLREGGFGCYEFVARKPITNVTEPFFDNSPDGEPFVIVDDIAHQLLALLGGLMSNNEDQ